MAKGGGYLNTQNTPLAMSLHTNSHEAMLCLVKKTLLLENYILK